MNINKILLIEGKSKELKSNVLFFMLFGVLQILSGLRSLLYSAISSTEFYLADVFFNLGFGIFLLICSRVLAKGKSLAIWLFGGYILFTIIYISITRHRLDYFIIIMGALVTWYLIKLQKQGEIS